MRADPFVHAWMHACLPRTAGLRKHNITWKVDFARPFCKEPLQGHLKEIAEEALERYVHLWARQGRTGEQGRGGGGVGVGEGQGRAREAQCFFSP